MHCIKALVNYLVFFLEVALQVAQSLVNVPKNYVNFQEGTKGDTSFKWKIFNCFDYLVKFPGVSFIPSLVIFIILFSFFLSNPLLFSLRFT